MDSKLKQTLVDYGKQVVNPLINTNAEDAVFTNTDSGMTSTKITDAIKEAYSKAVTAQTTADSATAAAKAAHDAANAAGTAASNAQATADAATAAAAAAQSKADSAYNAATAAQATADSAASAAAKVNVAQNGAKIQFTNAAGTTSDVTTFVLDALSQADTGYAKTYVLNMGETEIGRINIPKDYLVKSAEVKVCSTADVPVQGLVPGDKYIDFTVNAIDGTGTASHLYIAVKDLVTAYSAGYGITISNTNEVAIDAANVTMDSSNDVSSNGINVETDGILGSFYHRVTVTPAANLSTDTNVLTGTGLGNMLPSTTTDFTAIYNAINSANNATNSTNNA